MVCEHLAPLERSLLERGDVVTDRGQTWSRNCREWVYFDRVLALAGIRAAVPLEACVVDHAHRGTHDGSEQGLVCSVHRDAVMGAHPESGEKSIFRGLETDQPSSTGSLENPDYFFAGISSNM